MATTPTNNTVPSESPIDLKYNAGKIDEFVTSFSEWYVDRFGNKHYTIEGLKQLVLQHIYNLGWNLKGSFQDGGTVTSAGDLLQDETTNIWYRWDDLDTLPKTVPVGSTPESSGGTGNGKWQPVDVEDVLRKDLSASTGATLVNTADNRNVQEWIMALDNAEYRAKNITYLSRAHYKMRTKAPLNIVCMGDSITSGYDVVSTDVTSTPQWDGVTHATKDYPTRLKEYLAENTGCSVSVTNWGWQGDSSNQGYDRDIHQENPGGDIAVVMYGINDTYGHGGATHDSFISYMEKIVRRFIDWGIGVVVAVPASGQKSALWSIWGEQFKNMASVYGCAVVDADEVMYNRWYGAVQSDPVHFNSMGYARLGEYIGSMIMAGGLLSTYSPISSETQMFPNKRSNKFVFCDVFNNIGKGYNTACPTVFGSFGAIDPLTKSYMSFSFYLDAESAEVDVLGQWQDGQVNITTQGGYGGNVSYYSQAQQRSGLIRDRLAVQTGGYAFAYRGNDSWLPKRAAVLVGRGWKTITIYTSGTQANASYIQCVTIRPIPVHQAVQLLTDELYGGMESITKRLSSPNSSGARSPLTLSGNYTFKLPYDLHPFSRNQNSDAYDCGMARLIITCTGGTQGASYYEAVIIKGAGSSNAYEVVEIKKTGTWPAFSVRRVGIEMINSIEADSVAPGMPQREIKGPGSLNEGVSASPYGWLLLINASWGSSTPLTGHYSITLQSSVVGSGASASCAR